jgi:ribosome biogenesis GTPase
LPRIERYLALVRESGAAPVIVLNKADLTSDVIAMTAQIAAIAPGIPVHAISARTGVGIQDLERYFDGCRTVGLIGSSGVGKSTLTNELLGRAAQATQEVRAHDSRGRHTTTHRQLFARPQGGTIIDMPGMRGIELWTTEKAVDINFDDVEALAVQCKFRNCSHDSEPACAVRDAVGRGDLQAKRVADYVRLRRAVQLSAR